MQDIKFVTLLKGGTVLFSFLSNEVSQLLIRHRLNFILFWWYGFLLICSRVEGRFLRSDFWEWKRVLEEPLIEVELILCVRIERVHTEEVLWFR